MAEQTKPTKPSKVSWQGLVLVVLFAWTALVGSMVLLGPSLILLLIPLEFTRKIYRQWSGFVALMWFAFATCLLERWAKVRVVMTGTEIPRGEPAIIISNHRTRIDWMFMWSLCLRTASLTGMKIVLKDSLKAVPGFGWATQCFMFVFLARDKSKDLQYLDEVLSYQTRHHHPVSLVLFPEGTDLHPEAIAKSDAFALQHGLPKYKYVLHPKVVGWLQSMARLRTACGAVYDVTVAYHDYADGERPSEASLLSGRMPREVHVHVERVAMAALPDSPPALEEWLKGRFAAKEEALRRFYSGERKFPGPEINGPVSQGEMAALWACAAAFWGAASLVSLMGLLLGVGWLFAVGMAVVWFAVTRAGGADGLELRLHGPHSARRVKQD